MVLHQQTMLYPRLQTTLVLQHLLFLLRPLLLLRGRRQMVETEQLLLRLLCR